MNKIKRIEDIIKYLNDKSKHVLLLTSLEVDCVFLLGEQVFIVFATGKMMAFDYGVDFETFFQHMFSNIENNLYYQALKASRERIASDSNEKRVKWLYSLESKNISDRIKEVITYE